VRLVAILSIFLAMTAGASAQARSPALPVVFLGASVMEFWKAQDPEYFRAHPEYVVRGVAGQTTAEILHRTPREVVPLNPAVVVLLGGSNDLAAGYLAPTIVKNLSANVDLLRSHGAKVVLLTLTNAAPEVNAAIAAYAKGANVDLVDFASLRGPDGGLRRELTFDGLHPTAAGYKAMDPLVEAAIRKALAEP
jgi:lysophospholipase L1-like esterase